MDIAKVHPGVFDYYFHHQVERQAAQEMHGNGHGMEWDWVLTPY
jgi:hypothetical protein